MTTEIEASTEDKNEIFSLQAQFPRNDDLLEEIYAFKAKADPDTLYYHEAMRQPDWQHFQQAMELEIEQQVAGGIYGYVKRTKVPEGATILPAVWQLRRKRDVRTNEVKKYLLAYYGK